MKMSTQEAIQRYLKKCEAQKKSPNTIRQYSGYLRHFAEKCPLLPLHALTIELYLKTKKETPAHRGMHFKVIQAFYAYLEEFEGVTSPVLSKGLVGRPSRTGRIIPEQSQDTSPPGGGKLVITEQPGRVYAPVNTADAIERYIQFKAAEGSSIRTQEQYRGRLYPFAKAFPVVTVNVDEIAQYLASIKGQPETRFDYRKHIVALYHWLEKREEIPEIAKLFPRVKIPPKVRRVLSPEEMGRLFANAEEFWMKAALTLLIDSKIRATEMCTLTRENTFPDHIIVTGKTGQRSAPISRETYDMLIKLADQGPLFTVEGRTMKREYLRDHLKELMLKSGLDGAKLGPHILRHSASVQHIMFGGDLVSLSDELGHKTTKMTEKYAALAKPQVQEIHNRVNVLGHITGKDDSVRAICFGCNTEIKVKLEDVKKTECPKCKQKGKWYLPEVGSGEMKGES